MLMEGRQQFGSSQGTAALPTDPFSDQTAGKMRVERMTAAREKGDMELLSCAHSCSFYETDEQRQALLRAFVAQGLRQQEKVVLITDELTESATVSHLDLVGIDLQSNIAPGQLRTLTTLQTFLHQGYFNPPTMLAWLQMETRRAEAEGYSALRVVAEMTWALRRVEGSERLIEYETELNAFLSGHKCRILCQYDGHRFGPAVLQHVMTTHPTVVVGCAVCHNPYYRIAPAGFGDGPASVTLGRWLADLSARNQAMVPFG